VPLTPTLLPVAAVAWPWIPMPLALWPSTPLAPVPSTASPNTPLPLAAFDWPWTPAVEEPEMVVATRPTTALAFPAASIERIVVARVAVLVAPRTTFAAATGDGRTSAWTARALPAPAAAVSRERRERGIGPSAMGCPPPPSGPVRPGCLRSDTRSGSSPQGIDGSGRARAAVSAPQPRAPCRGMLF
jgi:hypothetical protein